MKYLNFIKQKLTNLSLMWALIFIVALWSVIIQDGAINRDGILYLKQAYLFSIGQWHDGFELLRWPFFPLIISFIYKFTLIDIQVVAHGLDLSLFGVATYFYLKILNLVYKQKNIIFFGGLILLIFNPIMDDYVGMILRDHGLWAGCMAGTYFYLKNINKNSLSKSLLWQFSFLFAGLFRPEALIFMISIPIFNIFFFKKKLKQKYSLKLVLYDYFLIFIIIGCFFILKITTNILDNPNLLGRINEFLPITLSFLNRLLTPLPLESSNHYMNLLIQKYPFVLSFFILCFLFVFKIFQGQGLLNTYLIYLYFTKKNKVNNFYLLPIYFLTLISLCLVCISFFSNFVLTDRYFIISHLWILIIISPILQSIFEKNVLKKNEIMIQKYLVILFLVFSFLNILFDSNHKDLEREAGSFLKELDINNSVTLINAHRIAYYAGFDLEKIINTSTKFSDKNQWIILNGKIDQFPSYLLSEYYVYEKFLHKNDGIFIFRKIS